MASDDFTHAPPDGPQCADCGKPLRWSPGVGRRPKRCPEHARDRERERQREYDRKLWRNPEYRELRREYDRELRRNPEYRERERERERERSPEYRELRRERQRKRARSRKLLMRLILRQRSVCPLCRRFLPEDPADIHVDHVVPVAKGGTSDLGNLQAVCAPCNLRKGAN